MRPAPTPSAATSAFATEVLRWTSPAPVYDLLHRRTVPAAHESGSWPAAMAYAARHAPCFDGDAGAQLAQAMLAVAERERVYGAFADVPIGLADNPTLGDAAALILAEVMLASLIPPPSAPGPFATGAPDVLERLLEQGRLRLSAFDLAALVAFSRHAFGARVANLVARLPGLTPAQAGELYLAHAQRPDVVAHLVAHPACSFEVAHAAFRWTPHASVLTALLRRPDAFAIPRFAPLVFEAAVWDDNLAWQLLLAAPGAYWAEAVQVAERRLGSGGLVALAQDPAFLARRDLPPTAFEGVLRHADARVRAAFVLALPVLVPPPEPTMAPVHDQAAPRRAAHPSRRR